MDGDEAAADAPGPDALAEAEIKGAAKWLVAASGAVVTVLVAGLQLRDIGRLDSCATLLAIACLTLALLAVSLYLATAARVLVAQRPAFADLMAKESTERGSPPDPLKRPKDPLLVHLT